MAQRQTTLIGVLVAIAITAALDFSGYSAFSALPLFPLLLLFARLEGLSRRELGFTLGRPGPYLLALLHPLAVLGVIAALAAQGGAIDASATDWRKAMLNCALIGSSTVLVAMLTEEGFFRGWLWASLERRGAGPSRVLFWSSLAFALWHVSPVVFETEFAPPARQIPIFLLNVTLLGAIWGRLRWISGSVVVASVAHGLWNGVVYALFGFGEKVGALGIRDTWLYGPELGWLGLLGNGAFLFALVRLGPVAPSQPPA